MEKRKGIINPKTCCQVGLVARDIEKTAALYAEVFGVPMPEINSMPPVEVAQTKFRGIASGTQARLCLLYTSISGLCQGGNSPFS